MKRPMLGHIPWHQEFEGTTHRILLVVRLVLLRSQSGLVAVELPLVYDKENTGADCTKPPLPERTLDV